MITLSSHVGRGEPVYDALMKQLFEKASVKLFSLLLGVHAFEIQELPRELTSVKEKKVERDSVDFLVWVKSKGKAEKTLFHVEFQSTNDSWIHQRLIRYSALLEKKYNIFPEQVVIYFGRDPLMMKEELVKTGKYTGYSHYCRIIDLHQVDAKKILETKDPMVALLSLLSNTQPVEDTLAQYLLRFKKEFHQQLETCLPIMNYLLQIKLPYARVMGLINEVIGMLGIKKEDLVFYKEGMEKGMKKGMKKGMEKGMEEIRKIILGLLNARFQLEEEQKEKVRSHLNQVKTMELLEELSLKVIQVNSIDEFLTY